MGIERRMFLGHGLAASFLLPAAMAPALARAAASRPGQALPLPPPLPPGRASGQALPPLVMLDPGHGGLDPGAIGVAGTYEKHIALLAAYDLKNRLEASGRYRVEMTRWQDVFVPLETRVQIAHENRAHLFVSMHADSILDHEVRGASVYRLSTTASDPQAAAIAASENSADRYVTNPRFKKVSPAVAEILASLVTQETEFSSARLQKDMVGALGESVELLVNPARHANFVVLESASIPSVLVEMGFMSNRNDEAALCTPQHRAVIAAAMERAVDAYFAADRTARMAG
ncbi:MAG TPA: N-acetylmuramoyl-L-alanine amidase [Acetobacteraceae bacterium]|nr:N-acetylmuramoyl-L-alanine amidase [Acetobacteraceae bacterium]